MPDNLHPTFAAILDKHTKPVAMEQADGWIVVGRSLATGSVVPPYRHNYCHDFYASLEEAHDHYADLERGEYGNWQAVAIIPCRAGIPLGAKVILP